MSHTARVPGDTSGTAVPTGYIGEQIRAVVAFNTSYAATDVFSDVATITLTAGVWDITSSVYSRANGATVPEVANFIGTSAGNNTTGRLLGENSYVGVGPSAAAGSTGVISNYRVIVAAGTSVPYYLKASATYTVATPQYNCRISAVRVG